MLLTLLQWVGQTEVFSLKRPSLLSFLQLPARVLKSKTTNLNYVSYFSRSPKRRLLKPPISLSLHNGYIIQSFFGGLREIISCKISLLLDGSCKRQSHTQPPSLKRERKIAKFSVVLQSVPHSFLLKQTNKNPTNLKLQRAEVSHMRHKQVVRTDYPLNM